MLYRPRPGLERRYRDHEGAVLSVSSSDVNDYLRRHVGPHTTAKDFRTWGASSLAAGTLAPLGAPADDKQGEKHILAAIDEAAEQLRNTRAVCRQSYIHPSVIDAYRDGSLHETWKHSRSAGWLDRADPTLLRTLEAS
jgi:DNA topoisomerase I